MERGHVRSPYPVAVLRQAAESFRQAWQQSAGRAGSWAHKIHCMHLEHPPRLRVLHEMPNPHDSPMMPLFGPGDLGQSPFSSATTTTGSIGYYGQSHSFPPDRQYAGQPQELIPAGPNSANQSLLNSSSEPYSDIQSQSSDLSGPYAHGASQLPSSVQSGLYGASQSHSSTTSRHCTTNRTQSSGLNAPFGAGQLKSSSIGGLILANQPQLTAASSCSGATASQSQASGQSVSYSANQSQATALQSTSLLGKRPCDANGQSEPTTASSKRSREQTQVTTATNEQAVLQCDVCSLCRNTDSAMQHHLESSGHSSASGCIRGSGGLAVVAPSRLRSCSRSSRVCSDLEIMCPACHLPIGCRFACGLHYSLEHQSGSEMWAARPVLARCTVSVEPENMCRSGLCEHSQTGIAFPSAALLHRHWREHLNCCPVSVLVTGARFSSAVGSGMLIVECLKCQQVFMSRLDSGVSVDSDAAQSDSFGAFCTARAHSIRKHLNASTDGKSGPGTSAGSSASGIVGLSLSVTVVDLLGGRISRLPPVICDPNGGVTAASIWSLQLARSLARRQRQILSRGAALRRRLRNHIADLRRCSRTDPSSVGRLESAGRDDSADSSAGALSTDD